MRQAERGLLGAGSRREATIALRAALHKLPLSDPARYPIGFTMALLRLGYRDGREVLLRHVRAVARADDKPYGVSVSSHSIIPDPHDGDPGEPDLAAPYDDLAGMVYSVYERHRDPVLLSGLLDLTVHADGCLAENLSYVLDDLALAHPRALLRGLRGKPAAVWRQTGTYLGCDTRRPPRYELLPVGTAYPAMSRIAKSPRDPLRRAARRVLANVRAEQQRQG